MKQIKMIVDVIHKFDYVVKIAKAVIVGFDAFNAELKRNIDEKE